jgi:hypothetical protein
MSALAARARRAAAEAERIVARSQVIVAARRVVRDPASMVKRCAWCGRVLIGRGWVPAEDMPDFVIDALEDHTTHGICERCVRRLERDGASRPLKR